MDAATVDAATVNAATDATCHCRSSVVIVVIWLLLVSGGALVDNLF